MRKNMLMNSLAFLMMLAIITVSAGCTPKNPQIRVYGQEATLSPVMFGVCSVFLKIENSGNGDDTLLGAKTLVPGSVTEIHDVKDGRMVKAEKIRIPSGKTIELKPKGLHIMAFKMPRDITENYEFTLLLTFEKSGEKQVPVKFTRTPGPEMPASH